MAGIPSVLPPTRAALLLTIGSAGGCATGQRTRPADAAPTKILDSHSGIKEKRGAEWLIVARPRARVRKRGSHKKVSVLALASAGRAAARAVTSGATIDRPERAYTARTPRRGARWAWRSP